VAAIGAIVEQLIPGFDREREVEIIDGYVGGGYAQTSPDLMQLIGDVARTEGIILDPVYTGKAFLGMTREIHKLGKRVIFLHTGGIFGLFPYSKLLI
jgi:D-cysteine desulfhydrase